MEAKMHPTFDIFTTAGGHARYVETVKNLAAARKRLKQLASKSSEDCFLYSIQSGIVELIVRPQLLKRLQKARSAQIVRGRLAS
jgi:hypothetical protein